MRLTHLDGTLMCHTVFAKKKSRSRLPRDCNGSTVSVEEAPLCLLCYRAVLPAAEKRPPMPLVKLKGTK